MLNRYQAGTGKVVLGVMLLLSTTIFAGAQSDRTRRVRFPRGRTTKVIKDAVVRGTVDRYILAARRGQTLTVHITSVEDNAVFDVRRRGSKAILSGAEETDWSGTLPRTGDYVIEVGGTRGNATYTLEITIR